MAFNFINGIQIGGEGSFSPYAHGFRHLRRMLRLWLKHVVGWVDVETSGANWDNVQLGPLTDGATDASNPKRFTSATGGFTTAMENSFLLVFPTAAPATAGGFADATRNGFYRIRRVYDSNTIDVEIFNGVHHLGLPLAESGLRFSVYRFQDSGNLPVDNDFFVLRGTGTGGNFDMRFRENYASGSYAATRVTGSPFADWVAGAPGSFSPGTRLLAETNQLHQPFADICWVWAVADLTQVMVWVRAFNTAFAAQDSMFMYIGDMVPFHPGSDPRPVVVSHDPLGGSLDEFPAIDTPRMLAADDTTQITGEVIYLSDHPGSSGVFNSGAAKHRSFHSGRYVRGPLVIAESSAGNEEVRGYYKNLDIGHFNGPRGPTPIGATRDRIRFFTQMIAPWNGSKIYRYVY